MVALSHALLLIASFFAAPLDAATNGAVCQSAAGDAQIEHMESAWSVRVFGAVRKLDTRDTRDKSYKALLRVIGRCVVKPGSENQRPVLFGSFATRLAAPDDQNLASESAEDGASHPRLTAANPRPTTSYLLRDPVTQLERPPRV